MLAGLFYLFTFIGWGAADLLNVHVKDFYIDFFYNKEIKIGFFGFYPIKTFQIYNIMKGTLTLLGNNRKILLLFKIKLLRLDYQKKF